MGYHHQHPATIAILGSSTLAEHVLAMLLEDEGYAAKLLKVPSHAAATTLPPEGGSAEDLLGGGVDVVLLWPASTLRDDAREALVGAMRSASATAKIPVLALPPTLDVAFQDELAVDVPLKRQFEQLLWIIRAVLVSTAGSVTFLDLAGLARSA